MLSWRSKTSSSRHRGATPGAIAGRDQDVPGPARNVRLQISGPLSCVEDQQPFGMGLPLAQPVQQRVNSQLNVGGLRHAQSAGQGDERTSDRAGVIRGDPPDHLVIRLIAMGVLCGELALPDSPEAVDRCRRRA